MSPGAVTEIIHFFAAVIDVTERAEEGGGAAHEQISSAVGRLRRDGIERGVFKDLPSDLMASLFFAPVGYMLKSELKGRTWTDAELDAAAEAVLDSIRA